VLLAAKPPTESVYKMRTVKTGAIALNNSGDLAWFIAHMTSEGGILRLLWRWEQRTKVIGFVRAVALLEALKACHKTGPSEVQIEVPCPIVINAWLGRDSSFARLSSIQDEIQTLKCSMGKPLPSVVYVVYPRPFLAEVTNRIMGDM